MLSPTFTLAKNYINNHLITLGYEKADAMEISAASETEANIRVQKSEYQDRNIRNSFDEIASRII